LLVKALGAECPICAMFCPICYVGVHELHELLIEVANFYLGISRYTIRVEIPKKLLKKAYIL